MTAPAFPEKQQREKGKNNLCHQMHIQHFIPVNGMVALCRGEQYIQLIKPGPLLK